MKGYLVFSGNTFYAKGGAKDFVGIRGSKSTKEAQKELCRQIRDEYNTNWVQLVDPETIKIVYEEGSAHY